MGVGDQEQWRRDEIVDSEVDMTMYTHIYLLQMRWRLKHNESIVVTYGITMACYPVHGPWKEEWGIWSISGATWGVVDTQLCYNQFDQYLRMFYKVLQYSTMSDDYATVSDDTEGMYGGHMSHHMIRKCEGK